MNHHSRERGLDDQSNSAETTNKTQPTLSKAIRRMLLTGTVVGASCYAIGVVTEYFRTGGKDGHGIDSFTVFESERRHR